ncbi:MAG TPA: hypothetical protein PLU53_03445 [Bacteroidia bacterium]|nr:hypothetical protein [Bacteroidia bacterium]
MKKLICLLGITAMCCSCNTLFKIIAGVHNPNKPVHLEELYSYAIDRGMQTGNIVFPKDSASFQRTGERIKGSLPRMDVFNHSGYRIIVDDSVHCSNPNAEFTELICDGNNAGIDSSRYLPEELPDFVRVSFDSKEGPYNLSDLQKVDIDTTPDYTVLIYWLYAVRRSNKLYTSPWEKNLLSRKNCSVRVIKVCLDKTYEVANH